MSVQVIHDDCLSALPLLEANSVHAIVTDPPAGISFMGRAWDGDRGGRDQWIAWMQGVAAECLRVCKPGGHALVWALPRTSHWTVTAWENAGWQSRDRILFLFGTGFPKALNASKAIDREAGAKREIVGTKLRLPGYSSADNDAAWHNRKAYGLFTDAAAECSVTALATEAAHQWNGWHSALKPACEDWWLLRKPLERGLTIAQNVLKHGTGGLNIDACRIVGTMDGTWGAPQRTSIGFGGTEASGFQTQQHPAGRWPANAIHDGSAEVEAAFAAYGERQSRAGQSKKSGLGFNGGAKGLDDGPGYGNDSGTASRFFFSAKASSRDRVVQCLGCDRRFMGKPTCGCVGVKTRTHPTVKPLSLMHYLTRMICPPGGTVLDPFAGTGTTGAACQSHGFNAVLIEREQEHYDDILFRLAHTAYDARKPARLNAPRASALPAAKQVGIAHPDLFAAAAE